MRPLARVFVGMLLGLCCAAMAQAAPRNNELILVTDLWPPFRIEGESRALTGIDPDLIGLLEQRLNLKIRIVRVPWVRALRMMRDGSADLMSGLARTPEREKYIHYIAPAYTEIRPAFYKLATTAARLERYADLSAVSIGFTRGSAYFEPFDSDNTLNKHAASDEGQLLRMLLGQRFDFIIGSDVQVDYEIQERHLNGEILRAGYQPEKTTALYFGMSRKSRFLPRADDLGTAIEALIGDGSVATTLGRYGIISSVSRPTPPPR